MKLRKLGALGAGVLLTVACAVSASADDREPVVTVEGQDFYSWEEYGQSDLFRELGLRCGTRVTEGDIPIDAPEPRVGGGPGNCSASLTNPNPVFDPENGVWKITVVVHVISTTSGTGNISDAQVQSQIDILNEDFMALPGTNGALGTDGQIQFELATVDPDGDPTTGITRSTNNSWFNDSGGYYNTLAWDPSEYLNIYTNNAGGSLGYVPFLPQTGGGAVGSNSDRVVCLWSAFGRDAPFVPYHQGRTGTHEVGHYLGLYHTFNAGCGSAGACYTSGDRICDTEQEANPRFGCPPSAPISCSTPDPYHNYMDYTDDLCMEEFTPEQVNRMRCTVEHWRPGLAELVMPASVQSSDPESGLGFTSIAPNPFHGSTSIEFALETPGPVRMTVHDVTGRTVRTLANADMGAGPHNLVWDGRDRSGEDVAMGEYFIRLQRGDAGVSEKVLMIR